MQKNKKMGAYITIPTNGTWKYSSVVNMMMISKICENTDCATRAITKDSVGILIDFIKLEFEEIIFMEAPIV